MQKTISWEIKGENGRMTLNTKKQLYCRCKLVCVFFYILNLTSTHTGKPCFINPRLTKTCYNEEGIYVPKNV